MPAVSLPHLFPPFLALLLLLVWPFGILPTPPDGDDVNTKPSTSMFRMTGPRNDWIVTRTIATLQVVANPLLNKKTSPIASKLFGLLHNLDADLVRYVPWFPYPLLGVAELEPPQCDTQNTTFWNFTTELQQEFLDTFVAVTSNPNKRLVINFSTQPTWMFDTDQWNYSSQPNAADWRYPRGRVGPQTISLVAAYYGRLASWMVHGHFIDECGHMITGGPALGTKITHWEVFNEPEAEHDLTPTQYNALFDAIIQSIRETVNHTIQFMGPALAGHGEWDWYQSFLDPQNHAPHGRVALQHGMATFHWYARVSSRNNATEWLTAFDQINVFLEEVEQVIAWRNKLSPTTGLNVNEAGVIPMHDNNPGQDPLPPLYFNMAAAVFTVLVAKLSAQNVDVVGSSQFVGCAENPAWQIYDRQYPGVSMTNWTSGDGNPRYWALKLYLQHFGPGDIIVPNTAATRDCDPIFVQSRVTAKTGYAVLLVNKSDELQTIKLSQLVGGKVSIVDDTTHDGPWKEITLKSPILSLRPFAVVVVVQTADSKIPPKIS